MTVELITTRDYEARTGYRTVAPAKLNEIKVEETSEMLLYEELSRARIRDLEEGVRAQRARSGPRASRRWTKVARWATRRAERFQA
ncbi:hypothetical protein DL991_38180 [Amycolatopsis sp. WAC 01375]|uniref:hypothetical protein n=1 Tax=Amycolatopsis sp. WAC 01375 TaxID=2203194 RepID=UPI000F769B54|nr:hypothetical protein [Amycolatopsis sp. WAC 01375]RSM70142.1 hypothetical protein DL991_38180 [Amycolatopsis sp. WAC 01375]